MLKTRGGKCVATVFSLPHRKASSLNGLDATTNKTLINDYSVELMSRMNELPHKNVL